MQFVDSVGCKVEFGLKIIVKLFPNNVLLKWNKLYGLDFIDDF